MKMAKLDRLFAKTKKTVSGYISLSICFLCLVLPYTAREIFIFILHFVFNTLSVKIRLLLNGLFSIGVIFLILPVYFLGFILASLLKKIFSYFDRITVEKVDLFNKENLLRRY